MSSFLFCAVLIARLMFISPFLVEGQSMDPTLHDRELFLIDRQIQGNHPLKRGDIVVFSFDDQYYYVKRVVGLPGETIKIKADQVMIKNQEGGYDVLAEPYLMAQHFNYGDERFFLVPSGEYLVFGDNRFHSKDSRTFVYPYVRLDQIYGRYIYP